MKVLIVKISSLGDIIHTLPALTDASLALPAIEFTWIVEESFADIPRLHRSVKEVIPIAWRRWRKQLRAGWQQREIQDFYQKLRAQTYDYVIDAQGLIKSAIITRLSKGLRCGLDWNSAWEPLASLAYQCRLAVDASQHAITRMRLLFQRALGYENQIEFPNYQIDKSRFSHYPMLGDYIVGIHGTSSQEKMWTISRWIDLAHTVNQAGYELVLPWGNLEEQNRANTICEHCHAVTVLPKLTLTQIASVLLQAKAAVAVDTGLGHLAAALNLPTISLYGPTDPKAVGTVGHNQGHLHLEEASAQQVWNALQALMMRK